MAIVVVLPFWNKEGESNAGRSDAISGIVFRFFSGHDVVCVASYHEGGRNFVFEGDDFAVFLRDSIHPSANRYTGTTLEAVSDKAELVELVNIICIRLLHQGADPEEMISIEANALKEIGKIYPE